MIRGYRFVHLSDIHFGQEKDGTVYFHNDVRDQLLTDCTKLKNEIGPADGVIVTGDIAYSGKESEYKDAAEWLDKLTAAVGCEREHVCVVPGNHDVNWERRTQTTQMIQAKILEDGVGRLNGHLSALSEEYKDFTAHPLFRPVGDYQKFAAQYGCNFRSTEEPFWKKDFDMTEKHKLRLIGLTSVQVSKEGEDKRGLVLGAAQYTITEEENIEAVVLLHHPTEWLLDCSEVERYFANRARIVMSGHEHLAKITKIERETGKEQLLVYSGATNPPRAEAERGYKYTYNWLEFQADETEGIVEMVLIAYPRLWASGYVEFKPDSERMDLDERKAREFRVKSNQFVPPLDKNEHKKEEFTGKDSFSAAASPQRKSVSLGKDSRTREHDFERLRLLFWRHLNWKQRIQILLNLELIPDSVSEPLPQIMESIALEAAWESDCLRALWDRVMTFVPPNEQSDNPF